MCVCVHVSVHHVHYLRGLSSLSCGVWSERGEVLHLTVPKGPHSDRVVFLGKRVSACLSAHLFVHVKRKKGQEEAIITMHAPVHITRPHSLTDT